MYRAQAERSTAKSAFANLEDYLSSLDLQVTVYKDCIDQLARLSQLSLKTNQFNLTTHRYTETDIARFIESANHTVFSFDVADKFGDYGITGLCILVMDTKSGTATIDTLLMSCRIIGRNIERAFMNYLVANLEKKGISTLSARYVETPKNAQVEDFYPACSFQQDSRQGKEHTYLLHLADYTTSDTHYIEVIDEPGN
jgi:FkbH-like protein